MSKVDVRLLYQKDSGLCLESINKITIHPDISIHCESCDCGTEGQVDIDESVRSYINWLEEELETALSVGEALLWRVQGDIFWKERNKSKNEKSEPKG